MPTPTPLRVRKVQLVSALYQVYANSGYGPQPSSPPLAVLAPDAFSQAILASMMLGTPMDMVKKEQATIPDPSKANVPRPDALPSTAPWPPLIVADVYWLTTQGISFYEQIPDPSNPPLTIT